MSRTAEEILSEVADERGEAYVEENRELILKQARLVGDLRDDDGGEQSGN